MSDADTLEKVRVIVSDFSRSNRVKREAIIAIRDLLGVTEPDNAPGAPDPEPADDLGDKDASNQSGGTLDAPPVDLGTVEGDGTGTTLAPASDEVRTAPAADEAPVPAKRSGRPPRVAKDDTPAPAE